MIHQVVNDLVTTDTTTPANYYEKAGKLSCRLQYYSINGIRDSKTHGTTRTKKQIDGYFYDMTHDPLFQPDSENDIPSLLLGQPFVPREKDESVKFLLPMISHSKLQLFRISNDEQKTSSFQPLFEKPIRNHNSRPYIIRHITYEKNDYILTSSGYANTLMTKISKENEKPFEFENAYLLDTAAKRVFIASPSTSAFTHKLNLKLFKYVEKDLCIYERGFPQILQYPKHFQEILNSNSNETYRIQSYQFFEEMPVIATTVNHVLYMFQTGSSGDLTTENKELLLNQARDLFINQNDNDDTINMKLLASRITYPYILKNNNKLYLLDPSDEPRTEQQEKTIDKNVLAFIHLKPDDQKKLFKDTTNLKTAKEKSFAIHNAMHQFVALDETSFLVDKYDKLYLLTLKSAEEMAREEQELLKKQKEHEIEQDNVKKMIRHEPQTAQKKIEQLKEKLKKKEAELQNDQENEKPNGKEIKRLTREIAALQKKIKEEEDNL
ncbi:hypothetical protein IPH67_00165 [bacterium]|nr:MAG: hypothetical protein IPH67_00165 [bacterium]